MPKKIVTKDSLDQLLGILRNWQGPLTWELYCEAVTRKLGLDATVTKQALMRYETIKKAFADRKNYLRKAKVENISADHTIAALQQQVRDLAEQVRRLEDENAKYKEKFVVWLHNIHMYMPAVDIGRLLNIPMTRKYKQGKD